MSKSQEKETFLQRFVEEFTPLIGMNDAFKYGLELMRLAKKKERYNLLYCNVGLSSYQEKKDGEVDNQVKDIAEKLHTSILIGGDPRGYALKILLPSGLYNTWGGVENGYGIPS